MDVEIPSLDTADFSGIPEFAALTPEQQRRAIAFRLAELDEISGESLEGYLANVVIDSRPEPMPWHQCIEDWQVEIASPLIPAIEQMAGIRRDYTGPRSFWYTLPRGHDKTGLIGRIANWACGYSRNPPVVMER